MPALKKSVNSLLAIQNSLTHKYASSIVRDKSENDIDLNEVGTINLFLLNERFFFSYCVSFVFKLKIL